MRSEKMNGVITNMKTHSSDKGLINSVMKSYRILKLFEKRNHQTFSEINEQLKMPVATLYRFMSTLIKCGMLDIDPKTKSYSLGPSIIRLGSIAIDSIDIIKIAYPFMEDLKQKTNETISLFIRSGFYKICVAKAESDLSIRFSAKIGELSYLHGGASGTVLMTGMSKSELDSLEASVGFPKLTEKTIVEREKIDRIIEKTKKDGYCVSCQERREDTAGVGVPIFDHSGRVAACLNISLPASRFAVEKISGWVELLREAGNQISKKNGYAT
jgi:IclR family acetate operon transcriptional repressor